MKVQVFLSMVLIVGVGADISVEELLNNNLDLINGVLSKKIPDEVHFKDVSAEESARKCLSRRKFGRKTCRCYAKYQVKASLDACEGLSKFQLTRVTDVEGDLNMLDIHARAKSVGALSCSGSAVVSGSACGAKLKVKGSITVTAAVGDFDCSLTSTLSDGCLKITKVGIDIDQSQVKWKNWKLKIDGLGFTIPQSVCKKVWSSFKHSQKLLDQITGYLESPLKGAINQLNLCVPW